MDIEVRDAGPADVLAICHFGAAHIPPHYTPLIGAAAAHEQVRSWWTEAQISPAVAAGAVVVADAAGRLVGVGQRGRWGADHVIYKLYVHPEVRSQGIGPQLIDALVRQLPSGTERVLIEHVAANQRAAAFYERDGFRVDRVEPAAGGDPRQATVWRVRDLP